jgi:hypothetical protein
MGGLSAIPDLGPVRYANTYGSLVEPKKHAMKVAGTEREVTP